MRACKGTRTTEEGQQVHVEGAAHQLLASDLVFRRKSCGAGNYDEKTMCAARPGRLMQSCGPAWGYRWHLVASGFPHTSREQHELWKEAAGLNANAELLSSGSLLSPHPTPRLY